MDPHDLRVARGEGVPAERGGELRSAIEREPAGRCWKLQRRRLTRPAVLLLRHALGPSFVGRRLLAVAERPPVVEAVADAIQLAASGAPQLAGAGIPVDAAGLAEAAGEDAAIGAVAVELQKRGVLGMGLHTLSARAADAQVELPVATGVEDAIGMTPPFGQIPDEVARLALK